MHNLTNGLTLGILGGGQLGRMSAMAAARLGISVIIFCPEDNAPASQVSKETIIASYDDKDALKNFSSKVDFISYEFENIPVETVEYLDSIKAGSVLPDKNLLEIAQDRIKEKAFANNHGADTARWKAVSSLDEIKATQTEWNKTGFVLKTTRFGYDGKGQIKCDTDNIDNNSDLKAFLEDTKNQSLIMEELIDFECEISVIVARDKNGKTECYGPMLNEHKNHILHKTTVPSNLEENIEQEALSVAKKLADAVNLTGVFTVEFFVTPDRRILVNEIAPRTHNSGHWSIDACAVSQFENHVRTVCGLPVGSIARHSDATMLNLIGNDIEETVQHYETEGACIHLYGKEDARNGRKMGHINFLKAIS